MDFPLNAFNGMYETVSVKRTSAQSFSKGRATKQADTVSTSVQLVLVPIKLGKVLELAPDADRNTEHLKFFLPINMGTNFLIQTADLIVRANGNEYGVTAIKDWARFGKYQSGIISFQRKTTLIPDEVPPP